MKVGSQGKHGLGGENEVLLTLFNPLRHKEGQASDDGAYEASEYHRIS
ncbi:MAG: hypothetical protein II007_11205 [Gammaproteobacteria bacterium]|nr:hypothetical protein [Gammaproteobacteria bacterium]